MWLTDEEKYREEWENSDAHYDIPFDDYMHNRQVRDYGMTDEDMDSGDDD